MKRRRSLMDTLTLWLTNLASLDPRGAEDIYNRQNIIKKWYRNGLQKIFLSFPFFSLWHYVAADTGKN